MRAAFLFLLTAALALAADISGTWQFRVETEMGSGSPSFVLKQDGDKVTGPIPGNSARPRSPEP